MTKIKEIEVILAPLDEVFTAPGGRHLLIPTNVMDKFGNRMAHRDCVRGEFGRPKVADLSPEMLIHRLSRIDEREVCVMLHSFAIVKVMDRSFISAKTIACGPLAELVASTIEAAPSSCFNLREFSDLRQDGPGDGPVVFVVNTIITWDFDPRCENQLNLPEQLASFN